MTTTLALYVPSKPVLIAARLKAAFEKRGMQVLARAAETPLSGFRIAIVPSGPDAAWLHTDVPDALPDELGRLLSQELRVRVTCVGAAESLVAIEIAEAGRMTGAATERDGKLLDSTGDLVGVGGLVDHLVAAGLSDYARSFEAALAAPRALVLGLLPKAGDGEVIEIDPTLSCPICGEAMRHATGPHGSFFGCVRFPTCRGRLTEKQAEVARNG